jgi:hypothetical protein
MCDFVEDDPEGGLATCVREDDHPGMHIMLRKDGKRYVDSISMTFIGHAQEPNL